MADKKELLATLLEALQDRSDQEEDKDLKTLFREVRDELRTMNGTAKENNADREHREFVEEMATKKYPALRSRMGGASDLRTPQG
jgi:hypothetical protein